MTHFPPAALQGAPQFHGVHYAAYGHSFGNVQTVPNAWPGSVYPARIRDLLHADPGQFYNQCQNGSTMAQIVSYAQGTYTQGTRGLVSLMGFKNDIGNHTAQAAFKQSIRDFLGYLLASSPQPTILIIKDVYAAPAGWALYGGTSPTNADVDTYNSYFDAVRAEYSTAPIIVADPQADGWDTTTMLCGDGLHPNDHGMAHIATSAIKALSSAPYRDGLNYGYAPAAPAAPAGATYAADTFTRTASTPGTTSTGAFAWNVRGTSGTSSWSTDGSHLVGATPGGDSACVVDAGHADGTILGTLVSFTAGDVALAFRVVDGSNLWLLYAAAGGYQLVKRVASNYTFLPGAGPAPASGDVLKVALAGNSITAYVNGASVLSTTDAQFASATAHGFWATDVGGTFDTFSVAA